MRIPSTHIRAAGDERRDQRVVLLSAHGNVQRRLSLLIPHISVRPGLDKEPGDRFILHPVQGRFPGSACLGIRIGPSDKELANGCLIPAGYGRVQGEVVLPRAA